MQAHGQPLKTLSREIYPIQESKNAFLYLRSEENSWYSCHYCGSKNTAGMVILSSFWASTLAVHPFALRNTNPWNCLPQMSTTNVETKVMETLEVLNSYPHLFALPNDCRWSSALIYLWPHSSGMWCFCHMKSDMRQILQLPHLYIVYDTHAIKTEPCFSLHIKFTETTKLFVPKYQFKVYLQMKQKFCLNLYQNIKFWNNPIAL